MNKLIQAGSACLMMTLPTSAVIASEATIQKPANVKSVSVSGEATAELSVPPLDHVEYPKSRPVWCNDEADFTKRDHKIVVVAGPCDSAAQCDEELQWMQRAAVVTYANRLVKSPSGIDVCSYTDQDIDDQLASRHYRGTVTVGGETKYEKVVQLEFPPQIQADIRQASVGIEVGRRLGILAFAGILGTVLLICSSGLLGSASRRVSRLEGLASLD